MIAALVTVPVTMPLLARLVSAEVQADEAQTYARAAVIGTHLAQGEPAGDVAGQVQATDRTGAVVYQHGDPIPAGIVNQVCAAARGSVILQLRGAQHRGSCWRNGELQVVTITKREPRSYIAIGLFVLVLALVAGLVNALGVMQLIRPMSRIGAALDQVSLGQSNVSMKPTGMHEIDQLIERLNATARAVESRENEILARVQVIQEMARLVAHEVRNPLQSLTLFTQLLVDADDRKERLELQESVQNEIQVLDDVVRRLLREGTTRGALRLQLEPVDVHAELVRLQRVRSKDGERRGITVQVEVETGLVAHLDRMLFVRSVQNLVTNAIRAAPDKRGVVKISASFEGPDLLLWVDDNGPGVDPTLGERVFELNVTGGKGTGLGLSLTRGVAEAHGGTVRFLQSPLGGARFEIKVPRGPEARSNPEDVG